MVNELDCDLGYNKAGFMKWRLTEARIVIIFVNIR